MPNSPKDGENTSRGFGEMESIALDPNAQKDAWCWTIGHGNLIEFWVHIVIGV